MGTYVVGFVIVIVLCTVGFWFVSKAFDRQRIVEDVGKRGGKIVSINSAPFGTGWFGGKDDQNFEVVYNDATGNQHRAKCKISLIGGVCWTEDRISPRPEADPKAIEAEITSLQARLAELEAQKQQLRKNSEGGPS